MTPVANSKSTHLCQLSTSGVAHVGGNIVPSQAKVLIDDSPAIVQTDVCNCVAGGPQSITGGSAKVTIQGKGLAGGGDSTAHQGQINPATCSKKVFIG